MANQGLKTVIVYFCLRCGHNWQARTELRPRRCAKCKSGMWDRPRVMTLSSGLAREHHEDSLYGGGMCTSCRERWPCPTTRLLAEHALLREAAQALIDAIDALGERGADWSLEHLVIDLEVALRGAPSKDIH